MKRICYTSTDVRRAVIELFSSSKGRRVAISAFVGEGAEAYLPKPEGLHLICWPKAGGTNPNVVRKLIKRGVRVSFGDSLHMKAYWTEDLGAIVTSANLSTNALGSGNLKEVGVLLAPGELDIDRLTSSIRLRPVSRRELLKLDHLHNSYVARNRADIRTKSKALSFGQWYESPSRPEWKLGLWEEYTDISSSAKAISKNEYGLTNPEWALDARQGQYRQYDWILCFRIREHPSRLEWMFADYIVRVPRSEKVYNRDYPYEVVQIWPISRYPAPPFRIDKRFRRMFSKAVCEFGLSRIKKLKSLRPPSRLVDLIHKHST